MQRRSLAKGLAWTVPTVLVGASAPATAASIGTDISVNRGTCYNPPIGTNTMSYSVCATGLATLPAGSTLQIDYAGGSSNPVVTGSLADLSTVTYDYRGSGNNGGRYGTIYLTLNQSIRPGQCLSITLAYDVGVFVTGQTATLKITSGLTAANNSRTTNDSYAYPIYLGGCH